MVDATHTHDPYGIARLPVEDWTADRIHTFDKNNKIHSDADVEAVIASIKQFGLIHPLIVDVDGVLIGGHKRFRALLKMGWVTFPVRHAKHLTKNQADAARIADNKTQGTEYDSGALAEELARLSASSEIDMTSLGLDERELVFLTEDLGDMDLGGLAGDLEAEIDQQDAETAEKVAAVDGAIQPLSKVFGFRGVPVAQVVRFKHFMAEIETLTGKAGADAFVAWFDMRQQASV